MRRALALSLAAVLLASAAPARAAYDPVATGTTKLSLQRGFTSLLKQHGARLSATAPATLKGGVLTFPASGGKVDPTTGRGVVETEGALVFRAGPRSLPLRFWQLKTTQRHAPLSAKVGGGQLKLGSTAKLTASREGFGEKVAVGTLKLSAKVAQRIDKKLRLGDVLRAGQPIGTSLTRVQPETITVLAQNRASLSLDPGLAAKLASLFVAVNPIFPAEHPGAFTFPLFAGQISPDATLGTVETQGAIEFVQIGGGQVFLREPWLDLGGKSYSAELEADPSPPYPGKEGRAPVAGLSLTGASVAADPAARTVGVTGASLSLGANLAQAFNEAFAKPLGRPDAFAAGDPLGAISFTVQGQ